MTPIGTNVVPIYLTFEENGWGFAMLEKVVTRLNLPTPPYKTALSEGFWVVSSWGLANGS